MQVLIILSDNATPTEFRPRSEAEQKINQFLTMPRRRKEKGKIGQAFKEDVVNLKARFGSMLDPKDEKIMPISCTQLNMGDTIIFMGDTIHRGAEWNDLENSRNIIFFTFIAEKYSRLQRQVSQFHPAILLEMIHGRSTELFKAIDEANDPLTDPPLYKFLPDDLQQQYERYRAKLNKI